MADAFNPSTQKAETGEYLLNLRPACSAQQVSGQPELQNETCLRQNSIEQKGANRFIRL